MLETIENLRKELDSFVSTKIEPEENYWRGLYEFDNENLKIQLKDNQWRVSARKWFAWLFLGLLAAQNVVVFGLVVFAYIAGSLDGLENMFSVLVSVTLGETYLVIKIIVEWIFHDIKYSIHGKNRNNKSGVDK